MGGRSLTLSGKTGKMCKACPQMGRKTPPRPSNRQNQEKSGRNPQKEGRTMKKKIWALGLVWLMLLGAVALADGGLAREPHLRLRSACELCGLVRRLSERGRLWRDHGGGFIYADGHQQERKHLERAQHGQQKTGLGQLWRIVDGRFQRRRKQRRDGSQLLRGGV